MQNRRVVNGPAIRAVREAKGMPLRELADRIGYDTGHLSRIERGQRTASPLLVREIAKALDVTDIDALTVPKQQLADAS